MVIKKPYPAVIPVSPRGLTTGSRLDPVVKPRGDRKPWNKTYLKFLNEQKDALITQIPDLKYHFVEIYHPAYKIKIPFLPIRCFRDFNLHNSKNKKIVTFLSSGSTNTIRAKHSFSQEALDIYSKNSCQGFKNFLSRHHLKNPMIISLIPPPSTWIANSLSAMLEMFQINGFCLKWCDVSKETLNSAEISINFINALKNLPIDADIIIFGTTFHHLLLIHNFHDSYRDENNKILKNLNISIIDTGGTKGKTQVFTLEETKNIFKQFYSPFNENFNFFSEYGMCELGSQAWSLSANHDGTFAANQTLNPFAIDLRKRKILSKSKTGFLSFIDFVNVESYGAIITEDLASIISQKERIFKLLGRAPDATTKGCSLHVASFSFFLKKETFLLQMNKTQDTYRFNFSNLLSKLNKNYWDKYSISDLKKTFLSLENLSFDNFSHLNLKDKNLKNKNILLISAANTPISFVYPLVNAGLNLAKSFTLKVPGVRVNDPLSEMVRFQILDLFYVFSVFFPKTNFFMSQSKSLENNLSHYDIVIAFGTNQTLSLIHSQCLGKTQFFGFGEIKNSFIINEHLHTPRYISKLCSAWNGRGCLTPVCLFINPDLDFKFIDSFFKFLSDDMNQRLKILKSISFHEHNNLFLESQFKKYVFKNSNVEHVKNILRSKFVTIINISKIPCKIIKQMNIDFSFGGSGFVYLLPISMKKNLKYLSMIEIFPKIFSYKKISKTLTTLKS